MKNEVSLRSIPHPFFFAKYADGEVSAGAVYSAKRNKIMFNLDMASLMLYTYYQVYRYRVYVYKSDKLINFLKKRGGLSTYAEIIGAGFSKAALKESLRSGKVQKIDRGLYGLSGGIALANPDLVSVSIKVPKGVVCLISALAFHEATSEIPKAVEVAIPRGSHANKITYPPVKFYRFAHAAWEAGIEEYKTGGHKIKVYNIAKTLADCFKFRNKIGMDVVRHALKAAVTEKAVKPKEIMQYARICRVDRIIKPILEVIL